MIVTFKANKMMKRINGEGRGALLDDKTVSYIRSLDGLTGNTYNWRSQVFGEHVVLLENGVYVNVDDCVEGVVDESN